MKKIPIKLPTDKTSPFVKTTIIDKNGKERQIDMHGYLVGIEAAIALKKKNNWHGLVILTGNVGDGKSSLTEGLAGLDAHISGTKLNIENVSWSTEKFIEKTDSQDNKGQPLWWDEAIQGASGRNMAITKMGNKLKMALVTKRFKRHTYYLCIDEINEYSWKLIKMADAWIHVKSIGLKRGYFDAYCKKWKIQFIYNAFKHYNKNWSSREVRAITPDTKGLFKDYSGLFIDKDQYDKMKLEETKQIEQETNVTFKPEYIKALKMKIDNPEWSYARISQEMGMSRGWFGNVMSTVNAISKQQV